MTERRDTGATPRRHSGTWRRFSDFAGCPLALVLLVGLAFPTAAQDKRSPAEEKGWQIAKEADRRNKGWEDTLTRGRMILRDRQGDTSTRIIESKTLEGQGDTKFKSLMVFMSPPDIRGTALLTHSFKSSQDAQWLYLPALKRIKRISAANRAGSFMGSEFTYEDLTPTDLDDYSYRLLREEKISDGDYYVLERKPVKIESGYSKQIAWIDKKEYRTLKVDFYDRAGTLLKSLKASDFELFSKKFWRARQLVMVNHLTGKSTELQWTKIQFQVGLRESDFTRTSLRRTD